MRSRARIANAIIHVSEVYQMRPGRNAGNVVVGGPTQIPGKSRDAVRQGLKRLVYVGTTVHIFCIEQQCGLESRGGMM